MSHLGKKLPKPLKRILERVGRQVLSPLDHLHLRMLARIEHPNGRRLKAVVDELRLLQQEPPRDMHNRIEAERSAWHENTKPLVDGSLGEGGIYDRGLTVSDACRASARVEIGLFLYLLIREFKPVKALELGTNIGISSAYQAAAMAEYGREEFHTLESSAYRLRLARSLHSRLGLEKIRYTRGLFTQTLAQTLEELGEVDYAFIDGHHQFEPTLDYFEQIWQHAADNAVFVFDDIRWSLGMKKVWETIRGDPRVRLAADFGCLGVCLSSKVASTKSRYRTSPMWFVLR